MWSYNFGKSWVIQSEIVLSHNYECVHLYSLLFPNLSDQGTLLREWEDLQTHLHTDIPSKPVLGDANIYIIVHQLLRMHNIDCLVVLVKVFK